MPETPERIAPGIYRLDAVPIANLINMLLVEDEDGWTLVDTGVSSSVGRVKNTLAALGSGPEERAGAKELLRAAVARCDYT